MDWGILLIILVFTVFSVLTIVAANNPPKARCDELGVRHIWTSEKEAGKTYMMCIHCKYKPNPTKNEDDRGSYDF